VKSFTILKYLQEVEKRKYHLSAANQERGLSTDISFICIFAVQIYMHLVTRCGPKISKKPEDLSITNTKANYDF